MKRKFFILVFLICYINIGFLSYAQNFDNSKINSGITGAKYKPIINKRIKVRINGNADKYDYDLFGRNNFEYFPLQLGEGKYKVSIFENVVSTRYRLVKTQSIKAEIKNPFDVFKASIQTVNWNSEMEIIKKAADLTKNHKTDKEKVIAIYNFVVDNFSYDYDKIKSVDTTYVPDIEKIYQAKKGICYDYSAVLASMLRSQNIPVKLIKGYSDLVNGYHAWNEVHLANENRWIVIDSTYDSVLKKSGKKFNIEKDKNKYRSCREY